MWERTREQTGTVQFIDNVQVSKQTIIRWADLRAQPNLSIGQECPERESGYAAGAQEAGRCKVQRKKVGQVTGAETRRCVRGRSGTNRMQQLLKSSAWCDANLAESVEELVRRGWVVEPFGGNRWVQRPWLGEVGRQVDWVGRRGNQALWVASVQWKAGWFGRREGGSSWAEFPDEVQIKMGKSYEQLQLFLCLWEWPGRYCGNLNRVHI